MAVDNSLQKERAGHHAGGLDVTQMRIIVKCFECAQQRVDAAAVTIRNCTDDDQWSYRFICPQCQLPTVAATHAEGALAAVAAGSSLETWRLPAELAEHAPSGPAFTAADQIELRLALAEPDWIEALCNPYTHDDE